MAVRHIAPEKYIKSSHRHLAVSNGITGVGRRPREETDGGWGVGMGGGGHQTPRATLSVAIM